MIEFRTLGTLDLRDSSGSRVSAVLVHPKRVALLAYLAVATPRGFHRRDTLLGLFWPESSQEHARASLRKAVHHLRRALGKDVIVGRGDEELSMAPDLLWCDAVTFEDAVDAHDESSALELYRGPLLDGFFVADTPELERWIESERARLRDRAFEAAWRRAEREAEGGHAIEAAVWGRRAAALAPDDEGALRRLVTLLDRFGDRAGAMSSYDDFARRLRQDHDVEPSAETQALMRVVRNRSAVPAAAIVHTIAESPVVPAVGQAQAREPYSDTGHVPVRRRWVAAAFLPVVLVLAGTFFAWRAWREPVRTEPLAAVPLTTLPGVARYPSFSPDGDHVAFTWTGPKQDNPDIYVQQIGSGSPFRLTTDPGNDFNPVWSPNGRWIALLRSQSDVGRNELRLIPPVGGPERRLAEIRVRGGTGVTPPYLAWCPDSTCLVVTDSPGEGKPDALFVISLATGEKRQLTHPQHPAWGDTNPAVSPDGKWLVFRRMAGLFVGELYQLPLGGGVTAAGEPRRLTLPTLNADYPAWMPDSKEILFSAKGSLWRLAVLGGGTPARLPFVGDYGLMPVVSRPQPGLPARLVYVRTFEDGNIWRVETSAPGAAASSPPAVAIASTRYESMPQFSPDGRRVAFTSDRSGTWEIWLCDADGRNAAPLTSMGAVAGYPHWSPDGERIVFHSSLEGQWDVYMIPAAGGTARNLTNHQATDAFPSFSRDGQRIYFSSTRTEERDQTIWKIPVFGGDVEQVKNIAGVAAQESPDGAYLYYVETIDRPSALWRAPTSGGVPAKVLDGVILANFVVLTGGIYYIDRPSGEGGVHYLDAPSGETRLRYVDFATRRSTTVARNLGNVDIPLTASRDGRTILYSRLDASVNDLMLVENFR